MQIDSAVVSVLLGIKSHDEVSSFKSVFGKHEHTKGTLKEGASMSIIRLEADLRACSLRSPASSAQPDTLCEVKDLICNRTLSADFLNFGRSRLTIGKVCSQPRQTR